jgi:hypothetical protein
VEETKPDERTRAAEAADSQTHAAPDEPPTPEEEAAAERAGSPGDDVAEHYKEMTQRGAKQKGEGRLP